uniref:Ig-like domain-containing protein n=1 Tax=Oncorhynchus kisutch TaxID=8019 RepID=A0A8C7KMX6_ONCKI
CFSWTSVLGRLLHLNGTILCSTFIETLYTIFKSAFAVCVGKDATLSCTIVGNPTPLITWEKEKLRLTSGGRFKMVDDGDVYRLTIYDLTLEDSGQYMCRAKNNVGEAYAYHSSAALVSHLPKGVFTRTCTVTEGKHAKLSCFVTGHPKPHIIWRKDGGNIGEGRRQIMYEDQAENFILKILYCKQRDNGLYTCNASNMAGHTYSAVLVIVKGNICLSIAQMSLQCSPA